MPANDLSDQCPKDTYTQLLHIGTGSPSVAPIVTGGGQPTAISFIAGGFAVTGKHDISGNLSVGGYARCSGIDSFSGAGALPLTTGVTQYTSNVGANSITIGVGMPGQIKTIVHVVAGGTGILIPNLRTGYATITFNAVGDSVTLMYVGNYYGWIIIGKHGVTVA